MRAGVPVGHGRTVTRIDEKHAALLASGLLDLGSPIGPEDELYDGGSARSYEFGRIYFHPRIGEAFEVHGLILGAYLEQGAELSGLGYPIIDESDSPDLPGGRMSDFEQGTLLFEPSSGVSVSFAETILVPQVTVKIEDGVFVPLGPGGQLSLDQFAAEVVGPGSELVVELIRSLLPGLGFRRVFESHTADEIQVLTDQAQAEDPDYEPPNLNNFLEIDCPPGFDTDALAGALAQLTDIVEYAYTAPVASDPSVAGTPNALLGGVIAIDNTVGVCGIAPQTSTRLISYFRLNQPSNSRQSRQTIADMIMRAQSELSFGDVLLLEVQLVARINGTNRLVPVETDPVVWGDHPAHHAAQRDRRRTRGEPEREPRRLRRPPRQTLAEPLERRVP
jgi:hypothetical protein